MDSARKFDGKKTMSNVPNRKLTPAEYLEFERGSEAKHEYYKGEIFAMAGTSRRHSLIAGNIFGLIHKQFKGRPCEVHQTEMRVKINATGLYTYPDIVAVCGKPEFEDAELDVLLNPLVIVEVLSKSTEFYDRKQKFAHYKSVASVSTYVLVSQSQPLVERLVRQPDEQWLLWSSNQLDSELVLEDIDCRLSLRDIYSKIDFDDSESQYGIVREVPVVDTARYV